MTGWLSWLAGLFDVDPSSTVSGAHDDGTYNYDHWTPQEAGFPPGTKCTWPGCTCGEVEREEGQGR